MTFYIDWRQIDGKPRWIIVNENGNIVNRNPSKDELKGLKRFPEKDGRTKHRPYAKYTEEELDYHLIQFFVENGRPPTEKDFTDNLEYPHYATYQKRFGSWAGN